MRLEEEDNVATGAGGQGTGRKSAPLLNPGKGLDSVKGGLGGVGEKGYPKGGYQKGWQPKVGKDTVKCEQCGTPGHVKTDCWSFKGKGGGGKAFNDVEGVDGFWEISAVNRVKTQNRYSAFADSDTESESEVETDAINFDSGEEKLIDRMISLLNLCPDALDRITNREDISHYQSQVFEIEDQMEWDEAVFNQEEERASLEQEAWEDYEQEAVWSFYDEDEDQCAVCCPPALNYSCEPPDMSSSPDSSDDDADVNRDNIVLIVVGVSGSPSVKEGEGPNAFSKCFADVGVSRSPLG